MDFVSVPLVFIFTVNILNYVESKYSFCRNCSILASTACTYLELTLIGEYSSQAVEDNIVKKKTFYHCSVLNRKVINRIAV